MANHHADIPNRIQARDVAHPGTWIAAVIVAMLALVFVQGLVTNPNYQWPVVWLYPVSYTHLTLPTNREV